MTFALYHLNCLDSTSRYEYTINGLIGQYGAPVLSDLLTYIIDNHSSNYFQYSSLIHPSLQDLPAYYAERTSGLTKSELAPIFTATYHDSTTLRSLLYNDVRAAIPELLI